MFAIQFLNTNEVWLMVKPEDIQQITEYIKTGKCYIHENVLDDEGDTLEDLTIKSISKVIKSSEDARIAFMNEQQKKYDKTKSAK